MTRQISDEELLGELQRLAKELDRPPTAKSMDNRGSYSSPTYIRRFGSWNKALKAAGLQLNKRGEITAEELISELQRLADKNGKTPTVEEMNKYGKYNGTQYHSRFGSWNQALSEANLTTNKI